LGFGGQTIAMREGISTVSYLHSDHLGSASAATNSSGVLTSWQRFDPWGKVRASANTMPTKQNFTGQYLDDTGLLYYNARYYDPTTARFISADTIAPGKENPQNRNRYAYTLNNPLKYTDPTGHCGQPTDSAAETRACEQIANDLTKSLSENLISCRPVLVRLEGIWERNDRLLMMRGAFRTNSGSGWCRTSRPSAPSRRADGHACPIVT
jgi:RHS repeat-associated protein